MGSRPITSGHKLLSKYLIGGGISEFTSHASSCKSHNLMMRSQLIAPAATGTYHFPPLGMRALEKLCKVIDEEMSRIGCLKVTMGALSSAGPWKKSGRWESFGDELMKLEVSGALHCLNPTHEEAITGMVAALGRIPLQNLPLKLYQISSKFRNEPRPRFGLLRCREFLMKDLYTFDEDMDCAKVSYDEICSAYETIFRRLGLDFIKALSGSGNIGGEMSHEYLCPAAIGEDKVIVAEDGTAWNAELFNNRNSGAKHVETNAIEIGHAFLLDTVYSKPFNAKFVSKLGKPSSLSMGCYGLGVSRMLATCVETHSTDEYIRWPDEITPFKVCVIPPKRGSKEHLTLKDSVSSLYDNLDNSPMFSGDVVIHDKTSQSIGKRVRDCNVLGFPIIVILGKGLLDPTPLAEVHFQNSNKITRVPLSDIAKVIENEFTLLVGCE